MSVTLTLNPARDTFLAIVAAIADSQSVHGNESLVLKQDDGLTQPKLSVPTRPPATLTGTIAIASYLILNSDKNSVPRGISKLLGGTPGERAEIESWISHGTTKLVTYIKDGGISKDRALQVVGKDANPAAQARNVQTLDVKFASKPSAQAKEKIAEKEKTSVKERKVDQLKVEKPTGSQNATEPVEKSSGDQLPSPMQTTKQLLTPSPLKVSRDLTPQKSSPDLPSPRTPSSATFVRNVSWAGARSMKTGEPDFSLTAAELIYFPQNMAGTLSFDPTRDTVVSIVAKLLDIGKDGWSGSLNHIRGEDPTLLVSNHAVSGQWPIAVALLSSSSYALLLGNTPGDKAEVESWTRYALGKLNAVVTVGGPELETVLKAINAHLFRQYTVSESITLADIALYATLNRISTSLPSYLSSIIRLIGAVDYFLNHPKPPVPTKRKLDKSHVLFIDPKLDPFIFLIASFTDLEQNGFLEVRTVEGKAAELALDTEPPSSLSGPISIATFLLTFGESLSTKTLAELLALKPLERAEVETWTTYALNKLTGSVREGGETLQRELERLDNHITSRQFLVSNRITVADIALYTSLSPIATTLSSSTTPSIVRLFDSVQHRLHLPIERVFRERGANQVARRRALAGVSPPPLVDLDELRTATPVISSQIGNSHPQPALHDKKAKSSRPKEGLKKDKKTDLNSDSKSGDSASPTTTVVSDHRSVQATLCLDRSLETFLSVICDITGVGAPSCGVEKCVVIEKRTPGARGTLTLSTNPVTTITDRVAISSFLLANNGNGSQTARRLLGKTNLEKSEIESWSRYALGKLGDAMVEGVETRNMALKVGGSRIKVQVLRLFDTVQHQIRQAAIRNFAENGAVETVAFSVFLPIVNFESPVRVAGIDSRSAVVEPSREKPDESRAVTGETKTKGKISKTDATSAIKRNSTVSPQNVNVPTINHVDEVVAVPVPAVVSVPIESNTESTGRQLTQLQAVLPTPTKDVGEVSTKAVSTVDEQMTTDSIVSAIIEDPDIKKNLYERKLMTKAPEQGTANGFRPDTAGDKAEASSTDLYLRKLVNGARELTNGHILREPVEFSLPEHAVIESKSVDGIAPAAEEPKESVKALHEVETTREIPVIAKNTESQSQNDLISSFDIRVGKILSVSRHFVHDDLMVMRIDVGESAGPREISAEPRRNCVARRPVGGNVAHFTTASTTHILVGEATASSSWNPRVAESFAPPRAPLHHGQSN
ncbi:hypothetical protein HDU93_009971 [Gonapodya sp. JEL0774]|nr:hypothetical protein HDU93_009971 [Gonapodya sp. JEL0774]